MLAYPPGHHVKSKDFFSRNAMRKSRGSLRDDGQSSYLQNCPKANIIGAEFEISNKSYPKGNTKQTPQTENSPRDNEISTAKFNDISENCSNNHFYPVCLLRDKANCKPTA